MSGLKMWQEIILWIGIGAIILLLLYPPRYIATENELLHRLPPRRYHFIFTSLPAGYRIDYPAYLWPVGIAAFMLLLAWLEFLPDRPRMND